MSHCRKCGKSASNPNAIPLQDTRSGSTRNIKTRADLVGNRVSLNDQRGMNQTKLNVKNPLGKK